MVDQPGFERAGLMKTALKDLGLTIEGTELESVLDEFRHELERAGIRRLKPHFYLSTEWGVPFETIAIGIPFYLARRDLLAMHLERVGHVEGVGRVDLMRYLRHEMGHVVNYAYRLYEREDWVKAFGSITQPYLENYRPQPFSRRYVRHLPGWYAQKHPDEDWSETFAVWITPDTHWRVDYAGWSDALAKLELCARLIDELGDRDPLVTATERDDDVTQSQDSLEQYYRHDRYVAEPLPQGLQGALRSIFEDLSGGDANPDIRPAGPLIRRLETDLVASVYRWTGFFPEPTRELVRELAERADSLGLVYATDREREAVVATTTLVTSLAMNHVFNGSYLS